MPDEALRAAARGALIDASAPCDRQDPHWFAVLDAFEEAVRADERARVNAGWQELLKRTEPVERAKVALVDEPLLGLATTRQLLEEIEVRMRVTQNSTNGRELGRVARDGLERLAGYVLDYRTVDRASSGQTYEDQGASLVTGAPSFTDEDVSALVEAGRALEPKIIAPALAEWAAFTKALRVFTRTEGLT